MPSERLRKRIAKGFSDAATTYDHWSALQQRVARRLAAILPADIPHGMILDAGCGTGALAELLHAQYPARRILGIDFAPGMIEVCRGRWADEGNLDFQVADVEQFTAPEPCGLVASSFSVHWLAHPGAAFARMAQWLTPGGTMAMAVPVDGSLPELREAYHCITGSPLRGRPFPTGTGCLEWLAHAGLTCPAVENEVFSEYFDDARQALHSFKGIGATLRDHEGYTPLTPAATRRLLCYYDQHFAGADGCVPVSYDVLLFVAEKPG